MTPRPNHQTPVNASRLLEHWQPSKEMNRASNHGHDTESRQLPRECYRGTRPTLATSNGLFPSLRAYDHRGEHWQPSKGMNQASNRHTRPVTEPVTTATTYTDTHYYKTLLYYTLPYYCIIQILSTTGKQSTKRFRPQI